MKVILGMLNNELLINLASRAGTFCSQVDAAVAYAQGSDHPLLKACKEKGLKLTFYGLLDEDGAVGVGAIVEKRGVSIAVPAIPPTPWNTTARRPFPGRPRGVQRELFA